MNGILRNINRPLHKFFLNMAEYFAPPDEHYVLGGKPHHVSPFDLKEIELKFPRFENEDSMTESEICVACHGCCNYVTVALETPRTKSRRDEYHWYLLHRNVEIFIDNDDEWQLLFKTPCDYLKTSGICAIYQDRPEICRSYDASSCSRTGKDHQVLFSSPREMDDYLNIKKKKKSSKKI